MKKIGMVIATSIACTFTMAAKANQCNDFGFSIHNQLNQVVNVDYSIIPEEITMHNYPSRTQMQPQDNFFFFYVPANKYLHLKIKDLNGNVLYSANLKKKLAPSETVYHGISLGNDIDPPGEVSLSNVESTIKTSEEQTYNGSCAQRLSGRYTLVLQ